jgi:glycosyltransferase involved in cell wall biosynthesis
MPRVSIIIPTFNCARFLERTLKSVFAQTYSDYEIIVVDDGSTDETKDLISYWDEKVTYIYQPNQGPSAARNLGVSKSTGELLAYLDADDAFYPEFLDKQVTFLDSHPECGIVHCKVTFMDENDRLISFDIRRKKPLSPIQGFCIMQLLESCNIQLPSVVERRTCYDRVGGFDVRFRYAEDYLHWILVALNGYAIGYTEEPLGMYRFRAGSLSKNKIAMGESTVEMFRVLAEENSLFERLGPEAEEVVRCHVAILRRELLYYYRLQGLNDRALKQSIKLVKDSPSDFGLYKEIAKSCIPRTLLGILRSLRETGNIVKNWKP